MIELIRRTKQVPHYNLVPTTNLFFQRYMTARLNINSCNITIALSLLQIQREDNIHLYSVVRSKLVKMCAFLKIQNKDFNTKTVKLR